MKCLIYICLSIIAINTSAQNISGLYSGTLTNDSLKMIQNYELALSEYKGKITGYSYITFVSNDTFYYGIKRIKATRENGQLIVEDVEMLVNNYPKRPDKGVHVTNTIPLPAGDSILNLNGTWQTNKTKRFYSIGGDLRLRKDNDSTQSPLISHLKELNVIQYQDEKKKPDKKDIAKAEIKQKPKKVEAKSKEIAFKESKTKEVLPKEIVAKETASADVAMKHSEAKLTSRKKESTEVASPNSIAKEIKPKEKAATDIEVKPTLNPTSPEERSNEVASKNTTVKETNPKENGVSATTVQQTIASAAVSRVPAAKETKTLQNKTAIHQTSTAEIKTNAVIATEKQKPVATSETAEKIKERDLAVKETKEAAFNNSSFKPASQAAIHTTATIEVKPVTASSEALKTAVGLSAVKERTTNTIQTVIVSSDSLILSFYDNGVVDGDSISVYVNNENIVSKVKLTEAAVKKTVYTNTINADEIKLTLVAENLGTLPPNTGLLIIQDGTQRYQIRFSADMQTNASVIIKKKKM